jgi:hypothetical protein
MRSTGSRARHLWRLARTCWSQPLSCDGHPAKRSIGDQWKDLDVPTVTAAGPPSSFPDQTPAPSVLCRTRAKSSHQCRRQSAATRLSLLPAQRGVAGRPNVYKQGSCFWIDCKVTVLVTRNYPKHASLRDQFLAVCRRHGLALFWWNIRDLWLIGAAGTDGAANMRHASDAAWRRCRSRAVRVVSSSRSGRLDDQGRGRSRGRSDHKCVRAR